MNPIKKLKRKRLSRMLKDGTTYMVTVFGTSLIGCFGMAIVTGFNKSIGDSSFVIGGMFSTAFLLTFAILLGINVFSKTSDYDFKIQEEMEEIENQNVQKEIEEWEEAKKQTENLKEVLEMLPSEHEDIHTRINQIYAYIVTILENYPIDAKEKYYLQTTLPRDIHKAVQTFSKLNHKSMEEMKPMLTNILDKKINQLEKEFEKPYENLLKDDLKTQIAVMEVREV